MKGRLTTCDRSVCPSVCRISCPVDSSDDCQSGVLCSCVDSFSMESLLLHPSLPIPWIHLQLTMATVDLDWALCAEIMKKVKRKKNCDTKLNKALKICTMQVKFNDYNYLGRPLWYSENLFQASPLLQQFLCSCRQLFPRLGRLTFVL